MNATLNLRLASLAYPWMSGNEAHEWANNVAFAALLEPPRTRTRAKRLAFVMLLRRIKFFGLRPLDQTGARARQAAYNLADLAADEIISGA